MGDLILGIKLTILMMMIKQMVDCEIIPIHIGDVNHRHFVRTTPMKNEKNLRSNGLIPVNKDSINLNSQRFTQNDNHNFEYSKRIGMPAKRSTYLQNTRNLIDHSTPGQTSQAVNDNFYEREKQKVFKREEMANYQPNQYQSNQAYQPPTQNHHGYIPSNNANNYDYHRTNQYSYGRNQPPSTYNNNQYTNNQPIDPQQQYNPQRDNSPDYNQGNDLFERELNDINLDNSFYDMPLDHSTDNGQLNQPINFNDPMNFDSYFV